MTRQRATFLCDLSYTPGVTPLVVKATTCTNAAQHEPTPTGYIASSEWADLKLKTHTTSQCPECLLWVIWTPRRPKRRTTTLGVPT